MNQSLLKLKKIGCDIDSGLSRFLDDEEFLLECIQDVIHDEKFDLLEKYLKEENTKEAFEVAHTLKGICANTSLTILVNSLDPIIEKLRSNSIDNLETKVSELLKERNKCINCC